ncbi:hypothetical protein MFIFM68171_08834 [Madurella fahalii]|uniref:Uncharacterized protein n=1 Tax=Madurella fahalii TaxID=1157608 RepID=A0ABQ0GLJ9_9PEZI
MIIVYSYSCRRSLCTWDRRLFTSLTILFSALASLSVGSLLGLLGAVHPWPLLGSLKLIAHHCHNGRRTITTLVVLAYLLLDIIGRLSLATFGLTYDLNENAGVNYPVMLNDFGTRECLTALSIMYDQSGPSTYNMRYISGQVLDREVEGSTVTYTYDLGEYRGLDEYPSFDRVVHSPLSCTGRNFFNESAYEKGRLPSCPAFLHSLDGIYTFYSPATDYIRAMHWDYAQVDNPSACITSYLYNDVWPSYVKGYERNATFFECTTCLKDGNGEPSLSLDLFFSYLEDKLLYASGILLSFGLFDCRYNQYSAGQVRAKEYGSQKHTMHFINNLNALRHDELGDDWYPKPVPAEYALHTAHLAARLPILAIMGAEQQLPRVTREKGASEQTFIVTSLEVKWGRPAGVLAAILAGQVLAVVVVSYVSHGVLLAASGKDLAESIQQSAGEIRYGTRTVPNDKTSSERHEVDFWNGVNSVFSKGEDCV